MAIDKSARVELPYNNREKLLQDISFNEAKEEYDSQRKKWEKIESEYINDKGYKIILEKEHRDLLEEIVSSLATLLTNRDLVKQYVLSKPNTLTLYSLIEYKIKEIEGFVLSFE